MVATNMLPGAILSAFSTLSGPHIRENFPDPCVIYDASTAITYAFATNNRKTGLELLHIQVAASTDDSDTWSILPSHDALPEIAMWQTGREVWAPDVQELRDGRFVLYYADELRSAPATHCIGAAFADHITGPYIPLEQSLICPPGGAIDAAGFLDHTTGQRYVVYKVDGNSLGHGGLCGNDNPPIVSTPLMLQEVDPSDGVTFIGTPVQLLDRDFRDGPLIEAPAMYCSSEGIYFLFFSSNCYTTPFYHTNYATATNVTGPYIRASRPLLITGDGSGVVGPGGLDIIHHSYGERIDRGLAAKKQGRLVVFHGRMDTHDSGLPQGKQRPITDLNLGFTRGMYSGRVSFKGHQVSFRQE